MPKTPRSSTTGPDSRELSGHAGGTSSASAPHLAMEHPLEGSTRPPKETWLEWIRELVPNFDEASLDYITIDALIEEVKKHVDREDDWVDAVTIRYWQRQGLLPYPVKRRHEGATRSLYPDPAATVLIVHLRRLQREGYTLEQIAQRLRGYLAMIYDLGPMDLWPAIRDAVRKREAHTQRPIREVLVTFINEDGWRMEYPFPMK